MADHEARDGALRVLIRQLADDDLIIAHRASEWLGIAPHIEADVAFSSIAQEEMGHAAAYFGLLQQTGEGEANVLALDTALDDRLSSVLLELPNGSGIYQEDPHYDWAFAIVRHYLYDVFESLRLRRLTQSSHEPLADLSRRIQREERHHLSYHETWMRRLALHGEESRSRLEGALGTAMAAAGDLCFSRPWQSIWETSGIYPDAAGVESEWHGTVESFLGSLGITLPDAGTELNGRLGKHTPHLAAAIDDLSEVHRIDPAAEW